MIQFAFLLILGISVVELFFKKWFQDGVEIGFRIFVYILMGMIVLGPINRLLGP